MSETRVPVVLAGHALRSLRDSGYSLAAALGEVIDNSIEAGARRIDVRLEEDRGGWLRRGRPAHIHRIVVADDGAGMAPGELHHYPQLGYSTRYFSTSTIGKYGVGAKLAALNFCTRLDVWSRADADEPWRSVHLDLDDLFAADADDVEASIAPPTTARIPRALADVVPPGTGTVVTWSKVDRLEEGRHAADADELRDEVRYELARMFRCFLADGLELTVDGEALEPHDPLFLMEGTRADRILRRHYSRADVEPRFEVREHYGAELIADEELVFQGHPLRLRVALHPPEVLRTRGTDADDPLGRALRLSENLGAISLVRLGREINYANVPGMLPFGVSETDRFIGIEIGFPPALDDSMGVRNVKRGVEPHGELRTMIRQELRRWIPVARSRIQDLWGDARRRFGSTQGEHDALLAAAARADAHLPPRPERPLDPDRELDARLALARDLGHDDEAAARYFERIAPLPYVLESVDLGDGRLLAVEHLADQLLIRLNERHPFYREVWEPVRDIATAPRGTITGKQSITTARRTVEALTLLVLAYARAESMAEHPDDLAALRDGWGRFLDVFLDQVRDVV